jgi:hypothetical protein
VTERGVSWFGPFSASAASGRQLAVGLAILALLSTTNIAATDGRSVEQRAYGLTILGPELRNGAAAQSTQVGLEWSRAVMIAENSPDDYGYPWPDDVNGQLVVSIVNGRGQQAVQQWQAAGLVVTRGAKSAQAARPSVPVRVRTTRFSYAQLEAIKDESISLSQSGVPDAANIWKTGPDWENNRVLITVDRRSNALFAALAARYGSEAIAVVVDPDRQTPRLLTGTRASDSSPFFGGARINTPLGQQVCTSGWPWINGSQYYIMTAGHCVPNGGTVSTPAATIGTVAQSTYENWNSGTGTVFFTGESTYRGDLALSTAGSALGRIYSQGLNSTVYRLVAEMWFGAPTVGDQFCTGGSYSFELCGYAIQSVNDIRTNYSTLDGTLRNVTRGTKVGGTCPQNGDSGGPVYTVRWDSQVAAKGIMNATPPSGCGIDFTDMDLAYWHYPGVLLVYPP